MPDLNLSRDVLSKIAGGNAYAIRQLEKLFGTVDGMPTTIEEASNLAASALVVAQAAVEALVELVGALDRIDFAAVPTADGPDDCAPLVPLLAELDDLAPRAQLGSISSQDDDSLILTGPMTSTVATGAAPFVVASTTRVANLNVERAGRADSVGTPSTYPANATDLPSVIALANALKDANQSKGI